MHMFEVSNACCIMQTRIPWLKTNNQFTTKQVPKNKLPKYLDADFNLTKNI